MQKLPMFSRKEIFRALGHTYPSLGEIFHSYSNVLRVMELTKLKASSAAIYKSKWYCRNTRKSKFAVISKKPTTLKNSNIVSKQDKFRCSFCRNNVPSTNKYIKNTPR